MEADLVVTDGLVITMNEAREVWEPGYVAIKDGLIAGVGPMSECSFRGRETLSAARCVVMPGLVNCHGHHGLTFLRGVFDEMGLAEWLHVGLWPGVRALDEERSRAAASVALAELLLGGVTTSTSSDWTYPNLRAIDGVLAAISESGMRAVVSRVTHDSPYDTPESQAIPSDLREDVDDVVAHIDRLRRDWSSPRIRIGPEPLGVMRCTEPMLRGLAEYARSEGAPLLMHVASSSGEVEGCRERHGMGCIEYLGELGILEENLLIAHCVWPSESEIRLLGEARIAISHNPVANLYYATGVSPLALLLDAGARVGIGVDTAATNNSQNLWETMKMALYLSKQRLEDATWGSAELALEMATIGGARALGLDDEIGSLEVGKQADLITVRTDRPNLTPLANIVSNLVYSQAADAVDTVVVGGDVLVRGRQLVRWDIHDLLDNANRVAETMLRETGLLEVIRRRSSWSWNTERQPPGE